MTPTRKLRSLQTQIILSILLAVVLAAAIAGIPTLWLIHRQLDAQVDSGLQADPCTMSNKNRCPTWCA